MKAVILAGGQGTRLRPYTKILPKPLMPIGDMPILEVLLRQMKNAGVCDVVLTVGHLAKLLRLYFNNGADIGLNIAYSYEDKPLGTAGPLSLVAELDDTFLVCNGDILTNLDLGSLVASHKSQRATATIATYQRQVKIDLGVIEQQQGRIVNYIEKPSYDYQVSMGIYVFEPRVLSYIPHNTYFDFPNLVQVMLKAGEKVVAYPFDGYWKDLGRIDDYEQAVDDFATMRDCFISEAI